MDSSTPPLLFVLSESRGLGLQISHESAIPLAPLEERSFEDGEFKLRPLESVRDRTVFVVQSLASSPQAPIAQRLVRLLFLLCGLRDCGARRTIAVIPYLAYARKDRRTQPRDPITTRYVAQLLEATGVQRLIALDVHNAAALDNAFRIGVDHLSALPMFAAHFAQHMRGADFVVASPDIGGVKRVQIFRELLQKLLGRPIDLTFVEKRRSGGTVSGGGVVGQVERRAVIVLDDLCASGGTLVRAATSLREAGASAVHVAVTHAPLAAGLAALLAAPAIADVAITDSVGLELHHGPPSMAGKLSVLPVAPLLGQALARISHSAPLADLLEHWPPPAL
jgi:ribose-phosphate pyrophosphokinase